jgi:hypothetical protein
VSSGPRRPVVVEEAPLELYRTAVSIR